MEAHRACSHADALRVEPDAAPARQTKDVDKTRVRCRAGMRGVYASPDVSNMAESIASRADLPAQTTNWNAG